MGMEGVVYKKRDRRIWIALKNLPIYYWAKKKIAKIIKRFSDVGALDNLTKNSGQFKEAIVQILDVSPKHILFLMKVIIENYIYDVSIEVVEDQVQKAIEGHFSKNKSSEGPISYESL